MIINIFLKILQYIMCIYIVPYIVYTCMYSVYICMYIYTHIYYFYGTNIKRPLKIWKLVIIQTNHS